MNEYYRGICEDILHWAKGNTDFDTGFVESVKETLERGYAPTKSQTRGLDNIVDRFNIPLSPTKKYTKITPKLDPYFKEEFAKVFHHLRVGNHGCAFRCAENLMQEIEKRGL